MLSIQKVWTVIATKTTSSFKPSGVKTICLYITFALVVIKQQICKETSRFSGTRRVNRGVACDPRNILPDYITAVLGFDAYPMTYLVDANDALKLH